MPKAAKKILYIEDDPAMLLLVKGMLSDAGYDVLGASVALEGIRLAKAEKPDLILMDINLPDMGGNEAATNIKSMEGFADVPIIAVTADDKLSGRKKSLVAGCDGYITKPIRMSSFVKEVEEYLRGKREKTEREDESTYLRDYNRELVNSLQQKIGELQKLNEILEDKVSERTEELVEKNVTMEKKHRELEKTLKELGDTQGQLIHSEKMASIGQLAAGVAHEINNPIGFINSNLGTLKDYFGDIMGLLRQYDEGCKGVCDGSKEIAALQREIEEHKEQIDYDYLADDIENILSETRDGTGRVSRIVQDLKEFSHLKEDEERDFADINKWIESTLNIVWHDIKYKADVIKEYGDIPEVKCYPHQLSQVFMNLLVNASHAIEGRGEIAISTHADGDRVVVKFSDTGKGMSPEVADRIFEPFYTTKGVGKGTGLGLSITYNIMQKHGGSISVESEEGKGTTFTIELPVSQGE